MNIIETNEIGNLSFKGALTITPEIAEEILKNNHSNRKLNLKTVNAYANDMMNDAWECLPDGCSICFDKNGNLINGQHRMNAIIKSQSSINMFVFVKDTTTSALAEGFDRGLARANALLLGWSTNKTSLINFLYDVNIGFDAKKITAADELEFEKKLNEEEKTYLDTVLKCSVRTSSATKSAIFIYLDMFDDNDSLSIIEDALSATPSTVEGLKINNFLMKLEGNPGGRTGRIQQFFKVLGFLCGYTAQKYSNHKWQKKQTEELKGFVEQN